MRIIKSEEISNAVKNLIIHSSVNLPEDTYNGLKAAFEREISELGRTVLSKILLNAETIEARRQASPDGSYVAKLFAKGEDAILKKVGEEATEVILASKSANGEQIVYETADLWFHCMVMLAHHGLTAGDVLNELARREGLSGIAEKNGRKEK